MADSIPSLRRKLAEAQAKIAELEARGPVEVERVVTLEVPVETVRHVDRFKKIEVPVDAVRYEYIDRVQIEYVTDPTLEATIRELQERLRQCISQSDS